MRKGTSVLLCRSFFFGKGILGITGGGFQGGNRAVLFCGLICGDSLEVVGFESLGGYPDETLVNFRQSFLHLQGV